MSRTINSPKLSKEYILNKVSQVSIFSAYLNISADIIQDCVDTGELICSPIRSDIHPTCGFRYDNKGRLKFKDFSGYFWGDCFDLVAFIMNKIYKSDYKVSDKKHFLHVLRHITFTFKDIFYGTEKDETVLNQINTAISNIKNDKPNIELVVRKWDKDDEIYWKQFGISIQWLNINFVYPVEQYYINRNINPYPKYFYDKNDPCYGYYLGQKNYLNHIKLYFPKRIKGSTRFLTNCNHLEGIYNLDKNNYDAIILTKSTKDRLCIGEIINNITSLYRVIPNITIGVINIPHETYHLRENEYNWLKSKSENGQIYSLMDNDRTGIMEAIWLRNTYNIIPVFIPKQYNCKDTAEFVSKCSFEQVQSEISNFINYIKSNN